MRNTCFNLTGFVQPTTVVRICNNKDDDGLMDRQFFALMKYIMTMMSTSSFLHQHHLFLGCLKSLMTIIHLGPYTLLQMMPAQNS